MYELLTYLIIKLAQFRVWYLKKFHFRTGFYLRRDRDEMNIIKPHNLEHEGFLFACCDCDLTHNLYFDKEDKSKLHCVPQRPQWYKYKLRG